MSRKLQNHLNRDLGSTKTTVTFITTNFYQNNKEKVKYSKRRTEE